MRKKISFVLLSLLSLVFLGCGRRADLQPLLDAESADLAGACERDEQQRLIIVVANQGGRPAKATSTAISFNALPPVILPTRPLLPAQSRSLHFKIPEECYAPDCVFTVTVDLKDEVRESDETNNTATGSCQRPNLLN